MYRQAYLYHFYSTKGEYGTQTKSLFFNYQGRAKKFSIRGLGPAFNSHVPEQLITSAQEPKVQIKLQRFFQNIQIFENVWSYLCADEK
jgi:hypothetical protein